MSSDVIKSAKWKGVLWVPSDKGDFIAFCPEHRQRLEIWAGVSYPRAFAQETSPTSQKHLLCPEDYKKFSLHGESFSTMLRRYKSVRESLALKGVKYVDLDDVYTPVLKTNLKPKDERFSVQVEIDTTNEGKKLVIYAADRENLADKTQIFIDPQLDKISFDGTGDVHPNMIFSKVVAYFKDGKTATLEQNKEDR